MIVSQHSAQRYVERIAPHMSLAEARAEIASHARAIEIAAQFGAPVVRLGNGAKLVLQQDTVVTVVARASLGPNGHGRIPQ